MSRTAVFSASTCVVAVIAPSPASLVTVPAVVGSAFVSSNGALPAWGRTMSPEQPKPFGNEACA